MADDNAIQEHTFSVEIPRRVYLNSLATVGTAGMLGFAGCLGNQSGNEANGNGSKTGGSSEPVEVLHGWTGGDGNDAITAVINGFKQKYPEMGTAFKAIGGTGNIQLNSLINRRLANNRPPSSFASWPGKRLEPYVESGVLSDIEKPVWEKNNMKSAYVEELKNYSKFDDKYVCVPISAARKNNLFYNTSVIQKAGVDPTSLSTVADLVDALAQVEKKTNAAGIAKSAKAPITIIRLWESTMQSTEGFQAYMDLIQGKGDVTAVKNSLRMVKQIAQYFTDDAPTLTTAGANQKLLVGKTGFEHQGSWIVGTFNSNNFTYEKEWGWVPFPNTESMFGLHSDSFVFSENGQAEQKTHKWLRYVGSKQAQIQFCKKFAMIPPRTDIPKKKFGPFVQDMMEDFQTVKHRPPTVEGLAANPTMLSDLSSVFTDHFMDPYEVNPTAKGIVDAFKQ